MAIMRTFYALSWLLFLLAILVLGWDNARPYHVLVGMLAFPGTAIAILWNLRKGKWGIAALGMSILTVLGYGAWWLIEILDRYDSSPGLAETVLMQFRIPRLLFKQRLLQEDYSGALLEAYWQLGMPILQVIFLVLIAKAIYELRKGARVRVS